MIMLPVPSHLIELKTQYCDNRRCLECAIGNAILKSDKVLAQVFPGSGAILKPSLPVKIDLQINVWIDAVFNRDMFLLLFVISACWRLG